MMNKCDLASYRRFRRWLDKKRAAEAKAKP